MNEETPQERLERRLRDFRTEATTHWRSHFLSQDTKPDGTRYGVYSEGDELAPFFSEAFLYNLLGKDEARSVLSVVRGLCELAGVRYR